MGQPQRHATETMRNYLRRYVYRLTALGRQAAKAEAERLAMLVREAMARKLLKLKTT